MRFSFLDGFSSRHFDWVLVLVVFVLSMIGLAAMYSVDLSRGETLQFFPKQAVALFLGLLCIFGGSLIHVRAYQSFAPVVYAGALVLLVLVLFFGTTIRGTTGWFRVAGFSFQPVEFAKLGLILFLAYRIARFKRQFYAWQFVVSTGMVTALLIVPVLFQPDLGSALIIGSIWFGLLLLSKTKWRYIGTLIALGVGAAILAWFFFFAPYQKERIFTFLHPERDPLGSGYNVMQSLIAIGSGNFFGRGLGFGSQSQLHFLPEAQTDFIFSVIGEELGFVGVGIVLLLYLVLFFRLIQIALHGRDDFATYTVLGVSVLFFVQTVINMCAAIGLFPVTGIPLPFLSYGGSSLLINCLLIGVAESVFRFGRA